MRYSIEPKEKRYDKGLSLPRKFGDKYGKNYDAFMVKTMLPKLGLVL